jgi:hypothetical protein
MGLGVSLIALRPTEVYSSNITHNLGKMAHEAYIYEHLWKPEEIGITRAEQLIKPLEQALAFLKREPEHFNQFNAPNGWGMYEDFVLFVEEYLCACRENPDAMVTARR